MGDLIRVRDLKVEFSLPEGAITAVDGVSFRVRPGSTVALVGESGSGKTVVSQSIMRILPRAARITSGEILFRDPDGPDGAVDLAGLDPNGRAMRAIRGGRISIIFQEPMTSLSPLHTVGNQVGEALHLHRDVDRKTGEEMTAEMAVPEVVKPPKAMRHNAPDIADLHVRLLQLTGGQDLAHLVGLTDHTVLKLLSETGADISKWPTEKHFTSWAVLAPGSHQSGKRRKRRRRRHKNRVGQIFRESAQAVGQSKHLALGGFHRRLRARRGVRVATVATARKLAVLYYRMLKYGFEYVGQGLAAYEQQYRQQQVRYLRKKAKALGFEVVAATG
ncbi:MAG: ATP-binding cassette domain-containing protein [Bacteroidetes bacterium]|nr:ATP-binding cassette domain-containing protein [Bacteroidota bacterium]